MLSGQVFQQIRCFSLPLFHKRNQVTLTMMTNSQLLIQSIGDAILLLDQDGYIQQVNPATTRLTGFSEPELINRPLSQLYCTDDDTVKATYETNMALKQGRFVAEGWKKRKDGSQFWAELSIFPVKEENECKGFSCVLRDVSERKQTELELRQNEQRYRLMVEGVKDYAIFMLDPTGHILTWNEGAKRLKGYHPDEIIGKHFSTFYTAEDLETKKPERELKIAVATGKYEEEGWRIRKNGSLFWANIVITALFNEQNQLIGFSKVTRDLTERKEAEKALKQSYERYRQLASELREANIGLQYANQELEQFTSIVSHDLQEPIRTIKSFLQLIDIKLSQGKYKDLTPYIQKSIGAANRMRELIQNLLHYSQLAKNEVVMEKIAVMDVVNEALQNLKSAVEKSGASIVVESEVEEFEGDRVQMVQLIQNLLSNALKFSSNENPQITIRCQKENGHVKFSIADNGIGIAASDMNKVFEIFRRLHTEKVYPGTGIGLAICKKIVDRHRGRIWPESEVGKGTTFHFTLNEEAGVQ